MNIDVHARSFAVAVVLALGCRGTGASGPVALFLANDTDNKLRLFELDAHRVSSVAAFDDVTIKHARFTRDGRVGVLVVDTAGKNQLWRWRPPERSGVEVIAGDVFRIDDVSDDGEVILATGAGPMVYRERTWRVIDTSAMGEVFDASLAPDGSAVALAAVDRACPSERGAGCPTSVWAVDLVAKSAPRRLDTGDRFQFARDPQLIDRETVMVSVAAACAGDRDACTYELRTIPWAGGATTPIARDAHFGRRAPDGTLAYHRGAPASPQRVEVIAGAEVGQVGFRPSLWSPDSRWISTTVSRAEQVTNESGIRETVERDYVVVRARDGVEQARSFPVSFANPVGWSAVPLTPGTARGRLQ